MFMPRVFKTRVGADRENLPHNILFLVISNTIEGNGGYLLSFSIPIIFFLPKHYGGDQLLHSLTVQLQTTCRFLPMCLRIIIR
jgi:hypothetical protein